MRSQTYIFLDQYLEQFYKRIIKMESSHECQMQKYRLQQINEIQTILTDEVEKRIILSKKHHKWVRIVGGVNDVLVGLTVVWRP